MPNRRAMARAVLGWSPVIITGVMPAAMQVATASAASGRGGSINAANPSKRISLSSASAVDRSDSPSTARHANARTRNPWAANRSASAKITAASMGFAAPSASMAAHRSKTTSGAPFM